MELARQLDEVDPFYRYEIAVRKGRLTESVLDQAASVDRNAAMVTFREIENDFYQQVSIYPKCRESGRLRPISTTFSVDRTADEEALRAAHDMLAYGTEPDRPIPINVVRSEGPAGTPAVDGPALLYVMNMDQPARPDLELRLDDRRLAFTNVIVTRGFNGVQASGDAQGGVFKVVITFHDGGKTREIAVETTSIGGKLPHTIVPGLEFLREWTGGKGAVLALPYGKELLNFGSLTNASSVREQANDWLKLSQELIQLQPVSSTQLLMPSTLTVGEAEAISEAVRLLNGETLESDWSGLEFHVGDPKSLAVDRSSEPLFQFLSYLPFSIRYDDLRHELDGVVAHWGVAQLADPSIAQNAEAGDKISIVPGENGKLYRRYGRTRPPKEGQQTQ